VADHIGHVADAAADGVADAVLPAQEMLDVTVVGMAGQGARAQTTRPPRMPRVERTTQAPTVTSQASLIAERMTRVSTEALSHGARLFEHRHRLEAPTRAIVLTSDFWNQMLKPEPKSLQRASKQR
jgi:hypothetical protein